MKTADLETLLYPSLLVRFEEELRAADGGVLIEAGQLATVRANLEGFAGEVKIWTAPAPVSSKPGAAATMNEVAQRCRLTTSDEMLEWIAKEIMAPTSLDKQMERLSPERRFRLYNRIHDILMDAGADEAAKAALAEAHQAVRESPELQEEMKLYIDALREP